MKYDTQVGQIQPLLAQSQRVLIALSDNPSIDELASGLALFLTLHQASKEVVIVSGGTIKVSQSHLFGIDQIRNSLPQTSGGDLTLTLEGVVAADGTVPALEKLDWFPEGANLNLVFHVLPGQTFEPRRILPSYKGSGFNLGFTIGASSLNALGSIYTANQAAFSGLPIVNIDNDPASSQFGQVNLIDNAPTVSEIMVQLIPALSFKLDGDAASNLIAGIYDETRNLTQSTGAETFMAIGAALQAGGHKPESVGVASPEPGQPVASQPLNQVFGFPAQTEQPSQPAPPPVSVTPVNLGNVPSPEDRPNNEQAGGSSPEVSNPDPNWLTPKIFKGGSIG